MRASYRNSIWWNNKFIYSKEASNDKIDIKVTHVNGEHVQFIRTIYWDRNDEAELLLKTVYISLRETLCLYLTIEMRINFFLDSHCALSFYLLYISIFNSTCLKIRWLLQFLIEFNKYLMPTPIIVVSNFNIKYSFLRTILFSLRLFYKLFIVYFFISFSRILINNYENTQNLAHKSKKPLLTRYKWIKMGLKCDEFEIRN